MSNSPRNSSRAFPRTFPRSSATSLRFILNLARVYARIRSGSVPLFCYLSYFSICADHNGRKAWNGLNGRCIEKPHVAEMYEWTFTGRIDERADSTSCGQFSKPDCRRRNQTLSFFRFALNAATVTFDGAFDRLKSSWNNWRINSPNKSIDIQFNRSMKLVISQCVLGFIKVRLICNFSNRRDYLWFYDMTVDWFQ